LTDGYCRTGIAQAATALPAVVQNGADLEAREKMALASLLGGLSLANAGLGAVHGFAGPIGGLLSAPHGAVCAALLPHVMDVNLRALRSRQADSPALGRFREVACLLTGNLAADAGDGVNWVAELIRGLGVPGLNSYGCRRDHFPVLVENAAKASSMRANPIQLSKAELNEVLERAL
jgi:alcohol dehydrogenase class IV